MNTYIPCSSSPTPAGNKVKTCAAFRWWHIILFVFLSGLSAWAILDFACHWLTVQDWTTHPASMFLLTMIMLMMLGITLGRWLLLPFMARPVPAAAPPGLKVAMVTSFVPGSEPIEMLRTTVAAMSECDYPHDTWVLDEGNDPEVMRLCLETGARHFSRKDSPAYQMPAGRFQSFTKHGNYNAWLQQIGFARYDLVTILDPDHIPHQAFLTTVVGFFADPCIAYVQAAQAYYNQRVSLVARGAAEETYGYFSTVQMASYRMGFPIITGSHNTHRMQALREVGGLPAHDAEDLMITYRYRAKGWQGVYVPGILARGLAPVDWPGYVRQQRRWARSVLDIKLRHVSTMTAAVSLPSRVMGLLHGLNYLHKSIIIPACLLLLVWLLLQNASLSFGSDPPLAFRFAWMVLALLAGEMYRQLFYLDRKREWGLHWRVAIMHYAKWPFLLIALWDVICGRKFPYTLTQKSQSAKGKPVLSVTNAAVILILTFATAIGIGVKPVLNPFLHITAGLCCLASAFLIWSERRSFPPPFDPRLAKEMRGRENSNSSLPKPEIPAPLIAE